MKDRSAKNSHSRDQVDGQVGSGRAEGPLPAELLESLNDTATDYPRGRSVHQLFAEQAALRPAAVAVSFGAEQLSYGELERRANQLAHFLIHRGVGPEVAVGICVERSLEMVIGILGILKAGGAYLPLDPDYPKQRLAIMLEDSRAPVVLTQKRLKESLPEIVGRTVDLDAEWPEIARQPEQDPSSPAGAEHLAYVIYTSGSTGRPKGAGIVHRSVVRLVRDTNYVELGPKEVFLLLAPISFDASTFELWGSLLNGARLTVYPPRRLALEELARTLETRRVSTLWLTSALFQQMVATRLGGLRGVRQLLAGGETLPVPHVERMLATLDAGRRLINGYGPTENTTFTCCHPMTAASRFRDSVPIGRPISNTRIFLLDPRLQQVPAGDVGELWAAGDGLARGYLNAPRLSAEKFVPDPFSRGCGQRLYRVGDQARLSPDGDVEFLGRTDHQIKIRGFRVELGEIEARLTEHPEVLQAVVLAREDELDRRHLVAYVVAVEGCRPSRLDLIAFLSTKLPDYMVPGAFVTLERLPLTPNGKVDRRALPAPARSRPQLAAPFVAPSTELEIELASLWHETLGIEGMGIHDPFWDLGGDSLAATSLIARIVDATGIELPLAVLFENPTVAQLAGWIEGHRRQEYSLLRPGQLARSGPPPLSFSQERVWLVQQLDPCCRAYLFPATLRFRGRLDAGALQRALSEIVRRHEIFRTSFPVVGGRRVQQIHPPRPARMPVVDLSGLPAAARDSALAVQLTAESRRLFDLTRPLPVRWILFVLGESEHLLSHVEHHIVHDGWAFNVFLEELTELYRAFLAGRPSPLAELPIQFADFALWQRQWIEGEEAAAQIEAWRRRLSGSPACLDLPWDRPRPPAQTFRGAVWKLELPPAPHAALRVLGRSRGTTFYAALVAVFAALLHRMTNAHDLCLGSPIANRRWRETEGLMGMFVNNVVLRLDLGGRPSFLELLDRVRETMRSAVADQDAPFDRVVDAVAPERSPSFNPLFQVMIGLHDAPLRAADLEGLDVEVEVLAGNGSAKFDLTMVMAPRTAQRLGYRGDGGSLYFEYNADLFDATTIGRLAGHFTTLLAGATADPERRLPELPMLSAAQRHQLAVDWNQTASGFGEDLIHELFEAWAERAPEAVALSLETEDGTAAVTYAELERRSAWVAGHLQALGVGADVPVGLCVERSLDLVVGVLAILRAGGAYLPLDPTYPAERLAFMLEDAKVQVLLVQEHLRQRLPAAESAVVVLEEVPGRGGPSLRPPACGPANLAYLIYTSGSTGRPKGVQVEHRQVTRLMRATEPWYRFDAADVWTLFHSFAFDFSVWEIWGALTNGGRLVIVPYLLSRSPEQFHALMRRQRVTVLNQTPSAFSQLIEADRRLGAGDALALRFVIFGGEALNLASLAPWVERHGDRRPRLVNMYGITETTVHVTYRSIVARDVEAAARSAIGRRIPDLELFLLDPGHRQLPIGATGELYVGGAGLARGYLDRPSLTAERFVPAPASDRPGGRLYRTGDLVRYQAGGGLEYLGRNDVQVKIRGHRIELGEIEAVLTGHPAVERAAVLMSREASADGELVAYVTAQDEAAAGGLRRFLGRRLPMYMVPSAIVVVGELPLSPTGKLDRSALARLPIAERPAGQVYQGPRNRLEARVAKIWSEVLGVARVGADDNFFDVGGHSLRLIQVRDRLVEVFGEEVSMIELFQHPTVAAMAERFAGGGRTRSLDAAAARRAEPRPGSIAVIAMTGRFPGAPDVDALWANLRDGVESIRALSDDELRAAGVEDAELADTAYVKARGIVDGADLFDARLFGYSPREAELIDPQQRLFLECAWEVLELAGYDPERFAGRIGVYAGVGFNTYLQNLASRPEVTAAAGGDFQTLISNDKDYLTTRVAYKLGLRGPGLSVQTACSTSLVAVHEACSSLRAGECDLALAGGVSLRVPVVRGYRYLEGGILSPDGHCRAFDASARGTVPGSGAGVVALKRLDEALADGDRVLAVIRGSATNNDGAHKVGFTAPSVDGQAEVIALAQADAGVDPETITLLEAHGTGTALGDPIEVAALKRAFGERTGRTGFCALGSIKTNIGHLDTAAGAAGLIKTVLALEHRQLPPSLHFERSNPEIDLDASPFYVNTECRPWQNAGGMPRRAGVSSFGIGGTNAHVILEQAPEPASGEPAAGVEPAPWQLLTLSAREPAALEAASRLLGDHLRAADPTDFADVAYTLHLGRRQLEHRRAVVSRDPATAVAALQDGGQRVFTGEASATELPVVFLYPGQGTQISGMASGLYRHQPAFRDALDECLEGLAPHLDFDLRGLLLAGGAEAAARLRHTAAAQPALFAFEVALTRLWRSWGIEPAALVGHSIGELTAAHIAGVFDLGTGLRLAAVRGRLMARMPAGGMATVPLSEDRVRELLEDRPGLWLAAINGPALCTVSGSFKSLDQLQAWLERRGLEGRRLETSHAFHSAMMEEAVAPFAEAVAGVSRQAPQIPFLSNVSGDWIRAAEARDPEYWGRHIRRPVRFAAAAGRLLDDSQRAFLEVGPGRALSTLIRQQPACGRGRLVAVSLPPAGGAHAAGDDLRAMLGALGRLWTAGARVDWRGFHVSEQRRRVTLPTYPFQRRRYWVDRREAPVALSTTATGKDNDLSRWFYVPVWKPACDPQPIDGGVGDTWVVLSDLEGLGARLAAELAERGGDVAQVVSGQAFARIEHEAGGRCFTLNPGRREHFRDLLRALPADRLPLRIVHAWTLPGASGSSEAGEHTPSDTSLLARGFYSLVALVQALAAEKPVEITITVVTRGGQRVAGGETLRPAVATVQALCRVIAQEHPQLSCRTIDVDAGGEALVRRLADELLAAAREPAVAYRGTCRWTQSYAALEPPAAKFPIRPGAVYLITGGLGRIGLTLARWLAECGADSRSAGRVPLRLVLTTRKAFPSRREWDSWRGEDGDSIHRILDSLRGIEALGAEIQIMRADVADVGRMRVLVAEVEERWGPIDGAIHCAGVRAGTSRPIIELDRATCEAQRRVKVGGLVSLDRALGARRLDFRIAMSSLSAVLGGLGMAAYAAANAAMDLWAWQSLEPGRRAGSRSDECPGAVGGPWLSIDWEGWRFDEPAPGDGERGVAGFAMTPREGIAAFGRLLAVRGVAQVVVSTGSLEQRLLDWVERSWAGAPAALEGPPAPYQRPDLGSAFSPPRTEVERHLAIAWQSLLGVESVGVDDDFFDLGGHSLLATHLLNRLNAHYPDTRFSMQALFEHPTVAGLAALIDASGNRPTGEAVPTPEAARSEDPALDDVDRMSIAEVDALLADLAREQSE